MKRALSLLLVFALAGCANIESNTRTERGPLLRTFDRPVLLPGSISADVRVAWPQLKLTVIGNDVCRAETVEEYAEDVITEKTSSAVGPSLSMGITGVLASAVLLGVSFLVSDAPNANVIDRAGHYGASTRQYVQGFSIGSVAVGVPSLLVGLFTKLGTGEATQTRRAEQVVSQKDARCNERPATGPMTLVSPQGASVALQAVDGALDVDGTTMTLVPEELRFADRPVELADDARAKFEAWNACVAVHLDAKPVAALSETGLLARADRLRTCRLVRGESISAAISEVDAELGRRRESGSPAAWAPGTSVGSFEEAVSAYAPKLKLAVNSKDLAVLDVPESAEGKAVLLEGIIGQALTENIGVVQVGERKVFLFIPPRRTWTQSFPSGTRVEVVALISGRQTVGDTTLPLLRAVWMRTAW